jgi:hypothetical protein
MKLSLLTLLEVASAIDTACDALLLAPETPGNNPWKAHRKLSDARVKLRAEIMGMDEDIEIERDKEVA